MTTNSPGKVWKEYIVVSRENWKLDLVDLSVSWSVQCAAVKKSVKWTWYHLQNFIQKQSTNIREERCTVQQMALYLKALINSFRLNHAASLKNRVKAENCERFQSIADKCRTISRSSQRNPWDEIVPLCGRWAWQQHISGLFITDS